MQQQYPSKIYESKHGAPRRRDGIKPGDLASACERLVQHRRALVAERKALAHQIEQVTASARSQLGSLMADLAHLDDQLRALTPRRLR